MARFPTIVGCVLGWTAAVFALAPPAEANGTTKRASVGPGGVEGDSESGGPAISADGRFVAFGSSATNLVRSDTNARSDVFLRDRRTGSTSRVSLGNGGVEGNDGNGGPSITPDGRLVAFVSYASNWVPGDTNFASNVLSAT